MKQRARTEKKKHVLIQVCKKLVIEVLTATSETTEVHISRIARPVYNVSSSVEPKALFQGMHKAG